MDKSQFYAKKHVFKAALFHFFDINLSCSLKTKLFFKTIILNHFNHER